MVRRGIIRISRSREIACIELYVDPEGAACVVVDRQDAADVASLLAEIARPLYAEFGEGDDDNADDAVCLRAAADVDALLIGGPAPQLHALRIRPLVRLAQRLEHFAFAPQKRK